MIRRSAISPIVIFVCGCMPHDSADQAQREAARRWGLTSECLHLIVTTVAPMERPGTESLLSKMTDPKEFLCVRLPNFSNVR
jgi:hypothetical protein